MADLSILAGATSVSVNVFIGNSSVTTGAGLTGLAYNTSGLTAYYSFSGASATSTVIALATLATVTTAYSSGGFKELDSTNMPGMYRLDLPNAVLAASKGRSVSVYLRGAANMVPCVLRIELTGVDNQNAVNYGLSSLPNATAGAVLGGLVCNNTSFQPSAFVVSGSTSLNSLSVSGTSTFTGGITAEITGDLSGSVGSVTGLTPATIATGVWTDTTSSDFTVSSSVGIYLYDPFPSNFANLSIETHGIVQADLVLWNGQAPYGQIAPDATIVHGGTALSGTSNAIQLDFSASGTDNLYQNQIITIISGTGAGQSASIASYVGATKVATINGTWAVQPDNSCAFVITSGGLATSSGVVSANVTQIAGQTAAAAGTVTFPASTLASTTNITAGTITTTTNLTNAPTAGDFTSAMKTSLNAATPASVVGAVGSVTGNVGGSVGSISGISFPSGFSSLTTAAIAASVFSETIETGLTFLQATRLASAVLGGVLSGAATTTVTILGAGVGTTRVVGTTDSSGNRTALTLTL